MTHTEPLNMPEEKQRHYAKLHEVMYNESIRLNWTPIPEELKDPEEWKEFCRWRNWNWRRFSEESSERIVRSLAAKKARERGEEVPMVAEGPPPSPWLS